MAMKIPTDGTGQGAPANQQISIRFLIRHPTLGWRVFPRHKVMEAQHGDLRLPEFAGQTIKIAQAYVTVRRGRVIGLQRLQASEWKLDSDGAVDQEAMMSSIIAKIDGTGAHPDSPPLNSGGPNDDELKEIRLALGC